MAVLFLYFFAKNYFFFIILFFEHTKTLESEFYIAKVFDVTE